MSLDFGTDFDFLQVPSETVTKNVDILSLYERQKRHLFKIKEKTILVDNLVSKYREKNIILRHTEKCLSIVKDDFKCLNVECQEACKTIKELHEKDREQEKKIFMLDSQCKELQLKCQRNESQDAATASHINQLQQYGKDRDSAVDALKLELNLVKDARIGDKRKMTRLSQIIIALTRNLATVADVVFTKRILNRREKMTMCKYMRMNKAFKNKKNRENVCELMEEEAHNSDSEFIIGDDIASESEETFEEDDLVKTATVGETDKGNESDNAISEDTGRGSSLACSDKSSLSPAYSIQNPSSVESGINNEVNSLDHTTPAQSSKYHKETKEIATSPIHINETDQKKSSSPVKVISKILVDHATSPLKFDSPSRTDNPDIVVTIDDALNDTEQLPSFDENDDLEGIEPLSPGTKQQHTDKYDHLCDENSYDGEIESILENMRVSRDLITPIPVTPARFTSRATAVSVEDISNEPIKSCFQSVLQNMTKEMLESSLQNCITNQMFERVLRKVITDEMFERALQKVISNEMIERGLQKGITNEMVQCAVENIVNKKMEKNNIGNSLEENKMNILQNKAGTSKCYQTISVNDVHTQEKEYENSSLQNVIENNVDNIETIMDIFQKEAGTPKYNRTISVNDFHTQEKEYENVSLQNVIENNISDILVLQKAAGTPKCNQTISVNDFHTQEKEHENVSLQNVIENNISDILVLQKAAGTPKCNQTISVNDVHTQEKEHEKELDDGTSLGGDPLIIIVNAEKELENKKSVIQNSKLRKKKLFKHKLFQSEEDIQMDSSTEEDPIIVNYCGEKMREQDKLVVNLNSKSQQRHRDLSQNEETIEIDVTDTTEDEDPISINFGAEIECEKEKVAALSKFRSLQNVQLKAKPSQNEKNIELDVTDTKKTTDQSPNEQHKKRNKKLTKLEKLRKNLLPKSKIKMHDLQPPKKLCSRFIVPIANQKNKSYVASLKNKEAFEKAVKILAEEKLKPGNNSMAKKTKRNILNSSDLEFNRNTSLESNIVTCSKNSTTVQTNTKKIDDSSSYNRNGESSSEPVSGDLHKKSNRTSPLKMVEAKKKDESVQSRTEGVETRRRRSSRLSMELNDLITLETSELSVTSEVPNRKTSGGLVELQIEGVETRQRRSSRLSTELNESFAELTSLGDEISENSTKKCVKRKYETRNRKISLDKDVMVVLEHSDVRENLEELENDSTDKQEPNKPTRVIQKCQSKKQSESSPSRRILRSSVRPKLEGNSSANMNKRIQNHVDSAVLPRPEEPNSLPTIVSYTDLDLFSDEPAPKKQRLDDRPPETRETTDTSKPHESILCKVIEKYGIHGVKRYPPKIPEAVVNSVYEKIEKGISRINEIPPNNNKPEMDKLVTDLKKLKHTNFLAGLIRYLADPQRKLELFNKITTPPSPPMTKSEQVLIYLIMKLKEVWPDIVNQVLNHIEYYLFKLNAAPEFDAIGSMAHFYAVLCRYIDSKSRLKLFMFASMYAYNFKAMTVIKQCLEVWMHTLPLAHMGIAKCPLVTIAVYLLHYYKPKLDTYNVVQDIRYILSHKYFYKVTEWNEQKLLDMCKSSIVDLKEDPVEKKMLRLALILLAKRQGPRWCQTKLITNMLQPLIYKDGVSETAKVFCVSILGALVKPYPASMKVHCEIILNQLLDILLTTNPTPIMQEALFTSLISLYRHNQNSVIKAMLQWYPDSVSQVLGKMLKEFVREKTISTWKRLLRQIYLEGQD